MQPWFITATNTDVGKTHITCMLIEALSKRGIRPGVFKPIETGVDSTPKDALKLLTHCSKFNQNLSDLSVNDVCPYQFELPAAPYVAKGHSRIEMKKIDKFLKKITDLSDIVLIEGAGGLMVPIEENFFMVDLISHFNAKALLITPSNLGCINDTLLSLNLLEQKGIPHEWCVNLHEDEDSFAEVTLPYYQDRFDGIHILPDDLDSLIKKILET